MIQSKLLDFWRSLHTNEKRIIKIILFSFPLIIVSIYLGEISKKISVKRLSLVVAQNNFDYVYDKALNFQQYSLAQKALSEYPQKRDFIFSESKRYPLIDFQLGEEAGIMFVAFQTESAVKYTQFFESLANHPEIEIVTISITPTQKFHQVKAFLR
ncbi:hypothetical protein OAC45_04420 [Gammaproteobacteria bacterium]|jgi:hypothetical protein|nr:hypothetical protein [Gammaproteobacteria bacterium]|tara:strand:- start:1618 stop:2085 length:468 start_codon:yes stop_codon:yes gene_type:complete